jgi:hypothetical protein
VAAGKVTLGVTTFVDRAFGTSVDMWGQGREQTLTQLEGEEDETRVFRFYLAFADWTETREPFHVIPEEACHLMVWALCDPDEKDAL